MTAAMSVQQSTPIAVQTVPPSPLTARYAATMAAGMPSHTRSVYHWEAR